MKSITVRDLRHKWPQAEAALAQEREILITRDSRPVAKLVVIDPKDLAPRKRFNAKEHLALLREIRIPGLGDALVKQVEKDRNEE
ncbi:MAG TPA: hypothetical protein VEH27_10755 [Methylomirabilota bacterium]|nr:hypothetical protein [Methylomirabilota bacterium]